MHRAESLLHILIPNLDLNEPGIDAAVAQGWIPGAPGKGNPAQAQAKAPQQSTRETNQNGPDPENKSDTKIESMVKAVAEIEMDETGHWGYHGHSSGLTFMRRMRETLGDIMGPDGKGTPFVKNKHMSSIMDSPGSVFDDPEFKEASPKGLELPPKKMAEETCRRAIEDATALLRIVHHPSFWESFERLYSTHSDNYTSEDQKFLPLFHGAMAVGYLFGTDERSGIAQEGYENATTQGYEHFKTARSMMDIADVRHLKSIQAVMMMVIFLQSSANLTQCYSYVGIAARAAIRLGLHRNYRGKFDPLEHETRKRVFWVVRKMDVYVGAMLGLPNLLAEDEFDQEFPTEIDDEYITRDGMSPMPEGRVSMMTAFNAHSRLVQVLSKIVRNIYPIKVHDKGTGTGDKSYSVAFSTIREIEGDLEEWKRSLPAILSPSPAPQRYTRVQHLLRLGYAHAQVMLYRPFLHFVAMGKRAKPVDQRAYACAASYVNVSRNIIHITTQMKQQGLLNGAFWFVMYTSFFAVLSLVYFAVENPDNATTQAIMKDAIEGKDVLASLAKRSHAADRCTATLDGLFHRMPSFLRDGQKFSAVSNKKRRLDGPPSIPAPQEAQATRSDPNLSTVNREDPGLMRRAGTFPTSAPPNRAANAPPPPPSYDHWQHSASSGPDTQTPTSTGFGTPSYLNYDASGQIDPATYGYDAYPFLQNTQAVSAITDLSSMMFPAPDEPFDYPLQPLTTFENTQQLSKMNTFQNSQPYSGVDSSAPIMAQMPVNGNEDNMEAQFYALPPYMQQQPYSNMAHRNAVRMGPGTSNMSAHSSPHPMQNDWASGRQQGPHDIQEIFGGAEFNPHFMSGFAPS